MGRLRCRDPQPLRPDSFGSEFGEGNALSEFTTFDQYVEHSAARHHVHHKRDRRRPRPLRKVPTTPTKYDTLMETAIGAGAGQTSSPRMPRPRSAGPAWAGHPDIGDPFRSHPGDFGPCEVSAGVDSKRLAPDTHGQAIDADPRLQGNGAHVILGDPHRGVVAGDWSAGPGLGCWLRNGLTQ